MSDKIKEFYEAISLGREVEFSYNGLDYFVSHDNVRWHIFCVPTKAKQYFASPDELMNNAKLEDEYLKDCWVDVDITDIF